MYSILPTYVMTTSDPIRKFGKQIQRHQLDLPEYAASFLNYKALKKVRYILDLSTASSLTIPPAHQTTQCDTHYHCPRRVNRFRYPGCPQSKQGGLLLSSC